MLHPCLLLSARTMEQLAPPAFNPHLKRVLKSYQSAAVGSLSGPSRYVAGWSDTAKLSPIEMEEYRKAVDNMEKTITESKQGTNVKFEGHYPPHVSASAFQQVQQMPMFIPMDSTRSEKSETILEGETIACFIVGGEKRLCLPQILNTVLRDFSLQQINAICDELHIFCSRCNPEQLEILKVTGILPLSAPSCGLITKTDAERLCNALLHRSPEKSVEPPSPNSFKVYHECFGKCKGIFNPEMYSSPYAKCIECVDCHGVFSPQKFVCHSHKALENRTCHWGFDSANWRSYLLLSKDQEGKEKLQDVLDIMKARFDFMNRFKRKQSPDIEKDDGKRARYEDNKTPSAADYQNMVATLAENGQLRGMSAFRPWSPSLLNALKEGKGLGALQYRDGVTRGALPSFLHTGPPVLLNPERVIPHSDTNRYERHFAPNVSLAPASQQKVKVKEEPNNEDEISGTHYLDDSLDLDVSSDTESSSFKSDSVPSTPKEDSDMRGCSLSRETLSPEHEEQLTMLRKLLDGQVSDSKEDRDKFIEEFVMLQMRQEEKLRKMVEIRKTLQQELEMVRVTKKEKLREAMEIKQSLRKDVESLVREHRQELKDISDSREQFKSELESLQSQKNCDIARAKAKYKGRLEQTRSQLQQCQNTNTLLKQQVAQLTAQIKKYNHLGTEQQTSPEKPCSPEAARGETENEDVYRASPQQQASPSETSQKSPPSVETVATLC